MPIDPDFYKKLPRKPEQHGNQASGDKHYVWGEGVERELDFTGINSHDTELVERHISEKGYLGIHGTNVAVDFDLCIADGACISACPVLVFGWNLKPQEGPTSNGPSNNLNEYDKSDPFAENSCIYCLACETLPNYCHKNSARIEGQNSITENNLFRLFNKINYLASRVSSENEGTPSVIITTFTVCPWSSDAPGESKVALYGVMVVFQLGPIQALRILTSCVC